MFASDLRAELRWLSSGFLLMLFSGFGQTYFIAIFAGHLKETLDLSDGLFGGLYTIGTLASAATLIWAGKYADHFPVRWLGAGVMLGLAAVALGMAAVPSAWALLPVFYGLRFFGQGMMTHVAMTAMGRWFNKKRGRAVSIAALGFPAGEALLPISAVALMSLIGWRLTWAAGAAALLLVALSLFLGLLKYERRPQTQDKAAAIPHDAPARRDWTRGEVLRSPLFYALMPGLLAQPFIQTGIFFNQVTIVKMHGWDLSWFAGSFPVLAGTNILTALAAGWLVDRYGARRLLPVAIAPLGVAALILVLAKGAYVLPIFMLFVGLTAGCVTTIQGAIWAELYGVEHLGAIRSISMAGVVFASALSPGLIGVLMDIGVHLDDQLLAMALFCFAAALWSALLIPRLNKLAAG